jgi:NAD(P)-dependent dehydrogenase (short-subunit alcohol dehydrogenase family)
LSKGESALKSITSANSKASISLVQLDITDDASIAAAIKSVTSSHGSLDVLINNAGICPETMDRKILQETFEVNAVSPALVTQAFAPLLLKAKDPRVIYVSSVLGSITQRSDPRGVSYQADFKVYRMSKAALDMLVACDAWEYKDKIKVWGFCPGYVITDLAGHRESKKQQGIAIGPDTSARGLRSIVLGKRDQEAGTFVYGGGSAEGDPKAGVYPW